MYRIPPSTEQERGEAETAARLCPTATAGAGSVCMTGSLGIRPMALPECHRLLQAVLRDQRLLLRRLARRGENVWPRTNGPRPGGSLGPVKLSLDGNVPSRDSAHARSRRSVSDCAAQCRAERIARRSSARRGSVPAWRRTRCSARPSRGRRRPAAWCWQLDQPGPRATRTSGICCLRGGKGWQSVGARATAFGGRP
jgi:hypothetical protein